MEHRCHAINCESECQPRFLMCRKHWEMVPEDLKLEVYATAKMRSKKRDSTWAPWWRAQARAVHHVALIDYANWVSAKAWDDKAWLAHQLEVADKLEKSR